MKKTLFIIVILLLIAVGLNFPIRQIITAVDTENNISATCRTADDNSDYMENKDSTNTIPDKPQNCTAINVVAADSESTQIHFKLGNYQINKIILADGRCYDDISAANVDDYVSAWKLSSNGGPALPVYSVNVAVPSSGNYSLKINNGKTPVIIQDFRPLPSTEMAWQDNNYDTVAVLPQENSNIYGGTTIYPAVNARITDEFQVRDLKYVQVQITPFQYNPTTDSLIVNEDFDFSVVSADGNFTAGALAYDQNQDFVAVQNHLAINSAAIRSTTKNTIPAGTTIGTLLIIAPDDWEPRLNNFITWKRQLGYQVILGKYPSETGSTPDNIKNYVYDKYSSDNITHLMIIGDEENVPCSYSEFSAPYATSPLPTDGNYAQLSGDDNYPDLILGRLSVDSSSAAITALNNLQYWEDGNYNDQAIMQVAVMVGSDNSEYTSYYGATTKDYENVDADYQKMVDADILSNATSTRLYTGVNGFTDNSTQMLIDALNGGETLMYYIGHAKANYLGTGRLTSTQVKNLINRNALPVIFLGGCYAGDFTYEKDDCLAEAFFRTNKTSCGATAVIAGTGNLYWDPPVCQMNTITDLRITALDNDENCPSTVGAYYLASLNEAIDFCQTIEDTPSRLHIGPAAYHAKVMHLFGDPTQITRLATLKPAKINSQLYDSELTVTVTGETDNSPLSNVRVCLDNLNGIYTSGITDENGEITFEFDGTPESAYIIRAISPIIPLVEKQINTNPADFNADNLVDISDVLYFTTYYDLEIAEDDNRHNSFLDWNEKCDINKDELVDITDVLILMAYYNGDATRGAQENWIQQTAANTVSIGLDQVPENCQYLMIKIPLDGDSNNAIDTTSDTSLIINQTIDDQNNLRIILKPIDDVPPVVQIHTLDAADAAANWQAYWYAIRP